jgi:hypothetical protein
VLGHPGWPGAGDLARYLRDALVAFGDQLLVGAGEDLAHRLASADADEIERGPSLAAGLAPDPLRQVADAACEGRLVSALEGGYAIDALPDLVSAYVDGVEGG